MRPSTVSAPLSSSALSYLESLERNAKALRGNSNNKKDESSNSISKYIAVPAKRRESISDIINQARRQASLSRTDSEDFDFLNESLKSSVFDEHSSNDTDSEESHEEKRILPLGTPGQQVGRKSLKDIRELRNSIDQSLIKTPELKMLKNKAAGEEAKKHAHFESIREEEVSEDLPKTQFLTKSPFKKAVQSGSEGSDADSIVFDEIFEEVLPSPKKNTVSLVPSRSQTVPFIPQKAVITAEKKDKKQKNKQKRKKEETPTSSSSESESSSSDSSTSDSESEGESASKSESTPASSTTETSTSRSRASSRKPTYESDLDFEKLSSLSKSSSTTIPETPLKTSKKNRKSEKSRKTSPQLVQGFEISEKSVKSDLVTHLDFDPQRSSSSSNSSKPTVRETHRTLEDSLKPLIVPKQEKEVAKEENEKKTSEGVKIPKATRRAPRSSSSSSSAKGMETQRELDYERRRVAGKGTHINRRRKSEENIHNMIGTVIDTHVQMLEEFNRMEYAAVCEWTKVLHRFDGNDGPSSLKLREIVERRLNRKY